MMSKLSDKKFIFIILIIGVVYFYFKGRGNNDQVDLAKVSFAVDGKIKTLADYQGQKVIVNFYASWCRPCMDELPAMAKTASEWDDVTFLWLNDENEEVIAKCNEQFKHNTFYLLDSSFKTIGIGSIPFTVLLNENGEVIYSKGGQLEWENDAFKNEIKSKFD